jgi:hypothetical protein
MKSEGTDEKGKSMRKRDAVISWLTIAAAAVVIGMTMLLTMAHAGCTRSGIFFPHLPITPESLARRKKNKTQLKKNQV